MTTMRPHPTIGLPAALLLLACGAPARSVPAEPDNGAAPGASVPAVPPPSPATAPPGTPDGKPVTITLTDKRRVTLSGFRIAENHGLSAGQCGVIIDRQRLMTMGVDDTEVYSCDALVAAGVIPPDGRQQRIGLIYDVSSPNAHFRTAVVLRQEGKGWAVDPTYSGKFDSIPAGRSIPALRRALRSGGG
ncbi:hypothetical protein ACQHGV_14020 [Sphingomonas pseudosanguinis]|uniref:hypothetical protein n=1 Tax=Sphingomonas pseudosanguinis TaxID=413712 RepID=UPI003F8356EC